MSNDVYQVKAMANYSCLLSQGNTALLHQTSLQTDLITINNVMKYQAQSILLVFLMGRMIICSIICDEYQLSQCASTMRNDNSAFGTNKTELLRWCEEFASTRQCIDYYIDHCLMQELKAYFQETFDGLLSVYKDLCEEGNPVQEEHLKHSSCTGELKAEHRSCYQNYRKRMEKLRDDWSDRVIKTYCTVQKYFQCTENVVRENCGEAAANFTGSVIERITYGIINMLSEHEEMSTVSDYCDSYQPE